MVKKIHLSGRYDILYIIYDISKIIKPNLIRVGWSGELPWRDHFNNTTLYEAKELKISCKF